MPPPFIAIEHSGHETIVRRVFDAARREWERISPGIPVTRWKERVIDVPGCVGAILMVSTNRLEERLAAAGHPVVNFSNRLRPRAPIFTVRVDDEEVGETAARHVMERGYLEAMFIGSRDLRFAEDRRRGFTRALEANGVRVRDLRLPLRHDPNPVVDQEMRAAWLTRSLPRNGVPRAVFCENDGMALGVIRHLLRRDGRLDPTYGVIGVDNSKGEATSSRDIPIALTSVDPDFEAVGRLAARTLHRMINTPDDPPPREQIIRGARLHVRESTAPAPPEDPRLKPVLDCLRRKIDDGAPPRIQELARSFDISDRTLLHWFRDAGLPPPSEYILNLRLERARRRIRETGDSMAEIAAACGFNKQGALSEHFKKRYGLTPREYRRQYSGGF